MTHCQVGSPNPAIQCCNTPRAPKPEVIQSNIAPVTSKLKVRKNPNHAAAGSALPEVSAPCRIHRVTIRGRKMNPAKIANARFTSA